MSYLNQPYATNFQELCAAMPLYYLDVFEMRAILRAQGHLLDGLCDGMERLVDVNFILTADEATIRQWEKGLKITYNARLTLDQRKRVVIGYIIGLGHIGEREIRGIIGQYTPNHVDFDFMRGSITILIEGEVFDEENLLETLLRRIPAHLGLKITIHIRKQYRQTIPFAQGGAIGSYFLLEPVTQEHISVTIPLKVMQGAVDYTWLTSEPPAVEETIRTSLPISHVGAAGAALAGDTPIVEESIRTTLPITHAGAAGAALAGDTPTPERMVRTRYKVFQGGTSTSEMAGDTPEVRRSAGNPVSVAQAAFDRPGVTPDTPEVERASTSREKAAGGLFCHTHIKSKLIE